MKAIRAALATLGAVATCLLSPLIAGAAPHSGESAAQAYTRPTAGGYYRVTISPAIHPIPISQIHNWTIHVESADGVAFMPRQLVINGGMPGHGHGLPTKPNISRYLGNGDFLVEGMMFQMPGRWQLIVGVTGPQGPDQAVFDVDIGAPVPQQETADAPWSPAELQMMKSLWLKNLPPSPVDPSNRFSGNERAAELGKKLFYDRAVSGSGKVSCADCHKPEHLFADDKRFSVGSAPTRRNAPGLLGASHFKWFYWDGRRDSLWSQAITPMETPGEMDGTRVDVLRYVFGTARYRQALEKLGVMAPDMADQHRFPAGAGPFAGSPGKDKWYAMQGADREQVNHAFADIGKTIAAYVEQLQPERTRFDAYVQKLADNDAGAKSILSDDERKGLRLFLDIGRTMCLRCHNGPMFTNFGFGNIGTGVAPDGSLDPGRTLGLQAALVDQFNCQGKYSDASKDQCKELRFTAPDESNFGAFKVPSLRGVAKTAPYLHDGRFDTLEEVIRFYTTEPAGGLAPSEIPPVKLSDDEIEELAAFLRALSDPYRD